MAFFHFDSLADGASIDFVPEGDVLVFSHPAVSAGLLQLATTEDGRCLRATPGSLTGDQRLFVVDNGVDTGIYHFTSSATSALVSAGELVQIAMLVGTNATALTDFVFAA